MPPGQRGILILWFENSLLVSHNAGQLVSPIQVQQGGQTLYPSIYGANITIHNIAANENELAVLTREDNLYYGSLGVLSNSIIKFADQQIWSEGAALMFTGTGMLDILTPLLDANFSAFDFQKCSVNIQAILMDPQLQVEKCKVMVSNPHSLGLQANFFEEKVTYNWNIKYRLEIYLKQQHLWGRTDPNFTSSLKRPTTSTLTVDVANKEISCIDNKPLSTLISIGCDLDKKIVVQKKISACSKGILDPVALQDNYSYVIEKEFYNPTFHRVKTDLVVKYPYQELGCPHLVYYNTPWKPVVELWREGRFQEVVEAEYVVREAYGQVAYTYSLTAGSALCVSQPQNWTTMEDSRRGRKRFFWNRENYVSCHDPNSNAPLQWPNVEYQILGGPTANQIIFKQRNGIYIFFLSIVDPYYSYCHLSTVFSIYVYGAYPLPIVPPQFTIFLLVTSILLSVWLAYTIPNFLRTERGRRIKTFWSDLCWGCKELCRCHRGRS
ncbi:PREDICTED: cation channel sperm-associated protein subunit delta [Galeopterus variegatus]|uniref:Cation channel sperm-associated auxiliary subunit delta n=1 Tax=Galeopterus variegatus TaxID=482537 RepID=A0ABM0QSE1_GALVR|nr:PREDICTED: cation channel sperm-associated protein subunit delta [Galeopterus variegatus]